MKRPLLLIFMAIATLIFLVAWWVCNAVAYCIKRMDFDELFPDLDNFN